MYEHGCGGGCGKFPGWCPQRILINGEDGDTRSRAGRRVVGLPAPLVQLLREHQAQQDMDRAYARQPRRESGRVFTSGTAEPLNPASAFPFVGVAEDAGFEPARACTQHAFQACAIGL